MRDRVLFGNGQHEGEGLVFVLKSCTKEFKKCKQARKELNFHMVEEGGNMGHFMQIIARNLPSISHLTIALSRLW